MTHDPYEREGGEELVPPGASLPVSSHTPGPWIVSDAADVWSVVGAKLIAGIPMPTPYGLANARLIAAAPDLLGALKHEVANCPMCRGDGVTAETFNHVMGMLPKGEKVECPRCKDSRLVIAKAEGRS